MTTIKPIVEKKVDVIVDLQYGSTGKGLIAGYLAKKFKYDVVMTANMPNAGHTFIDDTGRAWIHKVLPNGIVSPNLRFVMVGPGAIFYLDRLVMELEQSKDLIRDRGVEVLIHPLAGVANKRHAEQEQRQLNNIASTMQGSSAVMVDKIGRDPNSNPTARDSLSKIEQNLLRQLGARICSHEEWDMTVLQAESILLEGAQGFSLGINERFYPYCTSRDCTPARFMSDCAVPLGFLRRVIGTARLHPIRVGNTEGGYSGDFYSDQTETNWDELGVKPETTTVTGRVRRVFSFSSWQTRDAIYHCQPDWVFLNFCNYDPDRSAVAINYINALMGLVSKGGQVQFTGWGPTEGDVRETGMISPCDYTRKEKIKGYV